jgi:hypothetical protein
MSKAYRGNSSFIVVRRFYSVLQHCLCVLVELVATNGINAGHVAGMA